MTPAELVRAYARPNKKRLGQHFLTQVGLLDRMVACIGDAVDVIEVGPGPGTLTTRLLAAGKRVRGELAEREGFEPSMGLLPNRISNSPPRRDRRAS